MPADLPASACKLWRRGPVAFGPNWQNLDSADQLKEGPNAFLGFTSTNQIKSAGQFWLELPGLVDTKTVPATLVAGSGEGQILADRQGVPATKVAGTENDACSVFPNPVAENGTIQLSASFAGSSTFRLFDAKGNQVRKVKFEGNGTLSLTGLSAGVYAYRMENEGYLRFGQLVVGD